MALIGLEMEGEMYEDAIATLNDVHFDAIEFESRLNEHALQFLTFKFFK